MPEREPDWDTIAEQKIEGRRDAGMPEPKYIIPHDTGQDPFRPGSATAAEVTT